MKHLIKDGYLLTNQRHFAGDIEKGVQNIRAQWRAEHNIDPEAYSIFIAAGNEKSEIDFCFENLRRGVKEFLLKYSAPTSLSSKALPLDGNFVTVISVQKGSEGEKRVHEYL